MVRSAFIMVALMAVAACEPVPGGSTGGGPVSNLPEEVIAAADPRFVGTARLLDDGCYWYEHSNVVETTFLPLRTPGGRPICALSREEREARQAAAAAAAGT
ncbi:MAG: hypothetical protein AAFM92_07080 [Pseudomonadota bacterium]